MGLPSAETLIASVVQFLIEGGEEAAARLFLTCDVEVIEDYWDLEIVLRPYIAFRLTCPRDAYEALMNPRADQVAIRESIERAIRSVLPYGSPPLEELQVQARLLTVTSTWRTEAFARLNPTGIDNQGAGQPQPTGAIWNSLRFRSVSEVRIARALEYAGVLFLPNCRARLGYVGSRQNREADFLVCHEGNWGILEVDGEPFHPPSRKAEEDERDRLFKQHGILIVEHFDATACFERPQEVVRRFLDLLSRQ